MYTAGYTRTRAAAERVDAQASQRRPRGPVRGEPGGRVEATRMARERTAPVAAAPTAREESAPSASTPAPRPADAAPRPASSRIASALGRRHEKAAAAPATPTPPASLPEPANPAPPEAPAAAAPAADPVVAAPAPAATSKFKDGTYLGWGTSRHGDIQAAVVVEGGRITAARVEQCLTRYSCAWIAPIPPVILRQQGTTYDYVSGATESSDAFQEAVADALSHAL